MGLIQCFEMENSDLDIEYLSFMILLYLQLAKDTWGYVLQWVRLWVSVESETLLYICLWLTFYLIRSSDGTSKSSPSMFQGYVPSEEMMGTVFESHSSFSSETSSAQLPWERGRSFTAFMVCVSINENPNCRGIKDNLSLNVFGNYQTLREKNIHIIYKIYQRWVF